MQPRIAFCGESGSGKSTYAAYLAEHWSFEKLSIAKPMKSAVRATASALKAAGLSTVNVDDKAQMVGPMIDTGDAMRVDDPEILIESAIRRGRLWTARQDVPGIVVDDARYPNEAEGLKRLGFRIIRIVASPETCAYRVEKRDGFVSSALATSPMEKALQYVVHDEVWENETEEERAQNLLRCDAIAGAIPGENTMPN